MSHKFGCMAILFMAVFCLYTSADARPLESDTAADVAATRSLLYSTEELKERLSDLKKKYNHKEHELNEVKHDQNNARHDIKSLLGYRGEKSVLDKIEEARPPTGDVQPPTTGPPS
eukprot:CAMPEP_0196599604 /NCGR_PEP_ID=MMETSP1081-20130531/94943_1 /TAXON_ID=36882 /ORGANISM="Pyramimonas amylifera, Strain CCMP720" /LENGTH=115 /DNA_ID=CAMNT_0041925387 /DNA_START=1221 /DNA_END=1568 /DNA_ORIENTATION=-